MVYKNGQRSFLPFLTVWFGQLMSNMGNGLTAFSLGIYTFQLTGSATYYSLILLAAFLPSLLLKPIGGTLADRINRKVLMIIGDVGSASGLIFIIVMMFLGKKELWVIYFGTVISSIFDAFRNPAYKAAVTDLVAPELYSKASGLMQLAESAKFLFSPILAGFLLTIMNIQSILFIDVFTFCIAIVTVFTIQTTPKQSAASTHFLQDFIEGFRFLFRNKSILLLISIISVVTFFLGLFQALLGPMVLSFSDAQVFGTAQTVMTAGMLLGSMFIGIFGKTNKKIRILFVSLLLCGAFFSLLGVSTNIIAMTLFGFLFFLVLPFVNTSLDVLVRRNVESHIQGRIWSIVSLISQLGMAIAFGVAGYLADDIFNPLLESSGALASSIGTIIGVGPGRGIGLIFMLSGIAVMVIAVVIARITALKKLDMD